MDRAKANNNARGELEKQKKTQMTLEKKLVNLMESIEWNWLLSVAYK